MREQRVKEQMGEQEGEILVININLTRGLVVLLTAALLVAALLGYLAWNQGGVAASGPQAPLDYARDRPLDSARDRPLASSASMRQYYLTPGFIDGNGTLTACAAGYHFASLWEIIDPSNLKYNTSLGYTRDDSGQGPPSGYPGWVRTGYASGSTSTPGTANCNNWTSASMSDNGTLASLDSTWDAAGAFPGWSFTLAMVGCMDDERVWCVED